MDAPHLLRAARRAAAVSQRALAARAGVAPSVVGEIESGRRQPQVATLERLLHALGHELAVLPRRPSEDEALHRWLRASTSDRLRWAVGPAVIRALVGFGRGPFVLPPRVSAGVWLPDQPVSPPVPVLVPLYVATGRADELLRPERGPWAVEGAVPVGFGPFHTALVWPPDAPVMQELEVGPELRGVARLLHEQMRLDAAGRRRTAHRDSDPVREEWDLFHRPRFDRLPHLPDGRDRRDWRLGGEASLREWLGTRGFEL